MKIKDRTGTPKGLRIFAESIKKEIIIVSVFSSIIDIGIWYKEKGKENESEVKVLYMENEAFLNTEIIGGDNE